MNMKRLALFAAATLLFVSLNSCNEPVEHDANVAATNEQVPVPSTPPAAMRAASKPRSIMQPSVIPEPITTPIPVSPTPISRTVEFSQGGTKLDDAAKATLDRLLSDPVTLSGGPIVLRGSSDSAGSDRDNFVTSRKRAQAVAAYLKSKGTAADRLTVIALGEGRPIAPNVNLDGSDNLEGRARNRRVDIVISPIEGTVPSDTDESADPEPIEKAVH